MLDEKPNKQWLDSFITESRNHLSTFPSSALVTVLWALALLQHRPPSDWMHRCLATITAVLSSNFTAATAAGVAAAAPVSAAASSSVQLLQRPHLPGTAAAAAITAAAGSGVPLHLTALTPSQITKLIWSLAALDSQLPDQLMQLLTWQAESVISAIDSDDLAQLVWALDRLDSTQEKIWVCRFAASARAQLLAATGGALARKAGQGLRGRSPLQQGLGSSTAAMAAAGFKQVHGVSGLGQVVMIRSSRAAAAGQQQQGSGIPAVAAGGSTPGTAATVPGVTRIAAIAGLSEWMGRVKMSKQELYAKLMQMQQQ